MTKLAIIAVVVDTQQLTLYHSDGSRLDIPQGDPRVAYIVEHIIPAIDRGEQPIADFTEQSYYRQFEEKTNGFVRFFRAAKKNLLDVFREPSDIGSIDAAPVGVHGAIPTDEPLELTQVVEPQATSSSAAVAEIMANAQPVTGSDYRDADTDSEEHTMVAVVDGKIIPGAENLHAQLKSSVKLGSTVGMENFFRRMAGVIDKRRHSMNDLLRFLERADLPIADDGSVIAYKKLRSTGDAEVFVDCHTSKVTQRVGSFVYMNESLVDPNRHNECSNGLHIARRAYLKSFGGNVLVLCKIAPEDFIAVPAYDSNKVRVSGYHILFRLSDESARALNNDKSMTSSAEGQKMLGAAIAGKHTAIIERVQITEQHGGGLKIERLGDSKFDNRELRQAPAAKSLDQQNDVTIDPKAVSAAQTVKAAATKPKTPAPAPKPVKQPSAAPVVSQVMDRVTTPDIVPSGYNRKTAANDLYQLMVGRGPLGQRQQAGNDLLVLKKKSKVSWSALGLPDDMLNRVTEVANEVEAAPVLTPKASTKPATKKPAATPKAKQASASTAAVSCETRSQKARRLYEAKSWSNLILHKRAAKVGWDRLGFTNNEIDTIIKNGG